MQKCILIFKVEKWQGHLEVLLHIFPVQVLWVNQCAEDNEESEI